MQFISRAIIATTKRWLQHERQAAPVKLIAVRREAESSRAESGGQASDERSSLARGLLAAEATTRSHASRRRQVHFRLRRRRCRFERRQLRLPLRLILVREDSRETLLWPSGEHSNDAVRASSRPLGDIGDTISWPKRTQSGGSRKSESPRESCRRLAREAGQ